MLSFVALAQTVTVTINLKKTAQTIDNFGASGAWYAEGIGKHWPQEKKERMAEALFTKDFDAMGNPLGIGLSAWRFNIGGGTAEQGDSSGIRNPVRRVECFLSPDGTYNWQKQSGYVWFVKKAAQYGVENLIAFSNTPPVQFTKNGLGFNLQKDFKTNLHEHKYSGYAGFLATVLEQFKSEGLAFAYISPVNEPQWDWSNKFGQMNQEGSPWHNKDIFRIAKTLDSALQSKNLSTKILMPEAAILTALYEGKGHASQQIQIFYGPSSEYNVKSLKSVLPVIAGHSYFTDKSDNEIISVRSRLQDTAAKYEVPFWQTEYSMLEDGYKEGKSGRIPAIDCALFLAKIIHHDLTIANASAWQYWNAFEPGGADADVRYNLVALKTNADNSAGEFTITKNLWALGHYSRFVRPGMKRLVIERSDNSTLETAAKDLMLSAFTDGRKTVLIVVNYTTGPKEIKLKLHNGKLQNRLQQYCTTAAEDENMKFSNIASAKPIMLKPRSITTIMMQ